MLHLSALILHFFHAFIRLAGMPRRILITLMNLQHYNAIETFGSVYYQLSLVFIFIFNFYWVLFAQKRKAAKKHVAF